MSRRYWTDAEREYLRNNFPNNTTQSIADKLGRSYRSVSSQAKLMGIKKTPEFLASDACCRLRSDSTIGKETQFKPGQSAWNKGKNFSPGGRSVETRFKPGQKPINYMPIGSERITKDGLVQVKITDTGYPPTDWKSKHKVVWELNNGPLPEGHIVIFKDGNNRNFAPDNLEAITRSENMRRNTRHNRYSPEVNQVIQLRSALVRKVNRLTKETAQ
ncbi:HNH endonuclease signature motif containing protein [Gilvimarinus sp. 1_MG-2023]|uniref:HNH endonuclease signature motif containing protein n=1 Tax=Gilvimarinus sp. 1_MG-2023 TaxID=3062638 RepID=UPI0026E494EA|nr:HNH endonuclease signature motif containing protein [Gilvimarinus sp. 1_MG-2023]MDO6747169.1 HNH endonuclease signature motif containing protein [Gilvimarinus sp. 1_MG-2023]